MGRLLVHRLILALPTLALVSFISFALVRLLPGDPARARLGEAWTAGAAAEINQQLGLDRPWPVQYTRWVANLAQGDFGQSTIGGEPIGPALRSRFEVTLLLALYALLFAIAIGIPIGVISAVKQYSVADYALRALSIAGLAVPGFFLATLLLAYRPFGWTPPLGRYESILSNPSANLQLMAVPALLLGLSAGAGLMRITRTMMLEVLRQDYVRTARAKGLNNLHVLVQHTLRNALIPSVTVLGLTMVGLFGGSVIYESIFGLPGMGLYLLQSATTRDYPALQAITVVFSCIVILVNLVIDVLYTFLDPRLRRG